MDVVQAGRRVGPPSPRLLAAHKRTAKAISGLSEQVPADGGFLVQTDFISDLLMPEQGLSQTV